MRGQEIREDVIRVSVVNLVLVTEICIVYLRRKFPFSWETRCEHGFSDAPKRLLRSQWYATGTDIRNL